MITISFRDRKRKHQFHRKELLKVHSSDMNHFFPKNLSFSKNKKKKKELANVFYFVHVQNTGRLQKISPAY